MTNHYKTTLRNILYLCKFIGIINMSYILESDGLLIRSTDIIYKCLEFTRMLLLIIYTYYLNTNDLFLYKLYLFKLWSIIIASRISEARLIQLMNGIIEYDQKLKSLPRFLLIRQHSKKKNYKNYWNIILFFMLVYCYAIKFIIMYLWKPNTIDMTTICTYFIRLDFIVDVALIFSTYFFLQQLEYRFQMLNDSWKYLLPGFLSIPGELTHSITEMTLDKIRLLHADLSDLLRIFSVGYGQMLLGFFVFSYIDTLIGFYFIIHYNFNKTAEKLTYINFLKKMIPYSISIQNVIFILSIIIAASRVHEKKRKMISHLRLIRISHLWTTLKLQVKLFMNQISIFESSEITAYGIFNINLNLVVSLIILLITGFITLIQLKKHPAIKQSVEVFRNYIQNTTKEKLKK